MIFYTFIYCLCYPQVFELEEQPLPPQFIEQCKIVAESASFHLVVVLVVVVGRERERPE